jgi:hypothetical protein
MELLILVLSVALVGYFLARGDIGHASARVVEAIKTPFKNLFSPKEKASDPLKAWAAGADVGLLPEDFKAWLHGLSESESRAFTRSLNEYAGSLKIDLATLFDGRMDSRPEMKRVFVETIVIYSNAYRKVAEARAEAEGKKVEEPTKDGGEQPANDKQPAEKAKSRRSAGASSESLEVSAAV